MDVAVVWRRFPDFVDGALEEVQGANRRMRRKIRGAEFAPGRGENKRGVDGVKRHATVVEKTGEAPVSAAWAQRGGWQAHVVADDGRDVGRPAGAHDFFLRRAAASFRLSCTR